MNAYLQKNISKTLFAYFLCGSVYLNSVYSNKKIHIQWHSYIESYHKVTGICI